jgi:hypothetical protein
METKEQLINDDVYTPVGAPALNWEIPKRLSQEPLRLKQPY